MSPLTLRKPPWEGEGAGHVAMESAEALSVLAGSRGQPGERTPEQPGPWWVGDNKQGDREEEGRGRERRGGQAGRVGKGRRDGTS